MLLFIDGEPCGKGTIAEMTKLGAELTADKAGSVWQIYDDLNVVRTSLDWLKFEEEISRLTISEA